MMIYLFSSRNSANDTTVAAAKTATTKNKKTTKIASTILSAILLLHPFSPSIHNHVSSNNTFLFASSYQYKYDQKPPEEQMAKLAEEAYQVFAVLYPDQIKQKRKHQQKQEPKLNPELTQGQATRLLQTYHEALAQFYQQFDNHFRLSPNCFTITPSSSKKQPQLMKRYKQYQTMLCPSNPKTPCADVASILAFCRDQLGPELSKEMEGTRTFQGRNALEGCVRYVDFSFRRQFDDLGCCHSEHCENILDGNDDDMYPYDEFYDDGYDDDGYDAEVEETENVVRADGDMDDDGASYFDEEALEMGLDSGLENLFDDVVGDVMVDLDIFGDGMGMVSDKDIDAVVNAVLSDPEVEHAVEKLKRDITEWILIGMEDGTVDMNANDFSEDIAKATRELTANGHIQKVVGRVFRKVVLNAGVGVDADVVGQVQVDVVGEDTVVGGEETSGNSTIHYGKLNRDGYEL